MRKLLEKFDISVEGKTTIDIGASTGGFTDVMLQNGAKLVYAVDVGTNQLAWKLRQDSRVVSMEQFNFRYAEKNDFEEEPSFASIDVSFYFFESHFTGSTQNIGRPRGSCCTHKTTV